MGLLLSVASGSPSGEPTVQARNWIHHAKEVEEELHHPHRHANSKHGASFLAEKASAGMGKTRLLKELGAAEQAIQSQLTKDRAPAALKHQEYELLSKAMDAVHESPLMFTARLQKKKQHWAARRAGFIQKLQSKELRQKATAQVSTAEALRRSGAMLATYVKDMGKQVHSEKKLLSMSKNVKRQAAEALAQVHADSKTQAEVADLLAQAESMEKKEVKLETKELKTSRKQAREFKGFAARALKAEARRKTHQRK